MDDAIIFNNRALIENSLPDGFSGEKPFLETKLRTYLCSHLELNPLC